MSVASTTALAGCREWPPAEHLRLVACRRCTARARSLVEAGGVLSARCLRCGSAFDTALATERRRSVTVVGRGGQSVEAPMPPPPSLPVQRRSA